LPASAAPYYSPCKAVQQNESERPAMSAHDHRTSPLPFFALLAVFTIAVITAALYVSFGAHP
jgi:hypothetical protein